MTLAVQPGDPADFELAAQCPSPDAALRFEQSLRAIVSLAAATSARQPATAGLLAIHPRSTATIAWCTSPFPRPLDALPKLLSLR